MKLCVVWDWPMIPHQAVGWQDGLAAAIKELEDRGNKIIVMSPGEQDLDLQLPYFTLEVRKDIPKVVKLFKPDAVLMWGDATRPNAEPVSKLGIPMALCFAGGDPFGPTAQYFDHIFVESNIYMAQYLSRGVKEVSIAFGTNTKLFTPVVDQPKIYDTIFPGTFAHWKRHGIYSVATEGLKSLAVGLIQPNGIDSGSWEDCLKRHIMVMPHVTPDVLRYLYSASRVCVVTSSSYGGSQRTVLEAMSMNIPVVVTDSDKFDYEHLFIADPTPESVRGYVDALLDGDQEINTRDYILEYWSEKNYADALEIGLLSIV